MLSGIFSPAFVVLQELATSTEPAGALRKILDASVSDAERQSKPEIRVQSHWEFQDPKIEVLYHIKPYKAL